MWRSRHKHEQAYKDASRASAARYRRDNVDKIRDYLKRYRADHLEELVNYNREYRNSRPGWNASNCQKRKALMLGVEATLTKEEWQQILVDFNYRCAYCLQPDDHLEQEHMTPLARGGNHTADNVVPACRGCNGTKHTKTLLEYVCGTPARGTNRVHREGAVTG